MRSARPLAVVGLLVILSLGCQRSGSAVGIVTYKDKPIVLGTVLFEGSDGTIRQGNIKDDGSYSVSGLPIGNARVAVNSSDPKKVRINPRGKERASSPEVPDWFPIPKQYGAPSTSGLTYAIEGGQNKIDIMLK